MIGIEVFTVEHKKNNCTTRKLPLVLPVVTGDWTFINFNCVRVLVTALLMTVSDTSNVPVVE